MIKYLFLLIFFLNAQIILDGNRSSFWGASSPGCGSFAVGDIAHEDWDGTDDLTWTDNVFGGTVDDNESTVPSGECEFQTNWLQITIPSGSEARAQTYTDLESAQATFYARFTIYIDSEGLADGETRYIFQAITTASVGDGTDCAIQIIQTSGQLYFNLSIGTVLRDTYAISIQTAYTIEIYCSNSAPGWEWKIDGVSAGSGSNDPEIDFQRFKFGQYNNFNPNIPIDFMIDNFDLDDTWLGGEQ